MYASVFIIFFSGVLVGAAAMIGVYRRLSPKFCSHDKKAACAESKSPS